jgi:hypothetical protein
MMTRGPRVHTIMSTLPTNNLVQLMFYPRGVEMKLKEVELQPCLGWRGSLVKGRRQWSCWWRKDNDEPNENSSNGNIFFNF